MIRAAHFTSTKDSRLPIHMLKFRFDRAATISLFHPASNFLLGRRQARVPILMYHGIRPELGDKHPYFETNTTPDLFAIHMQFLQENGYVALDLGKALEAMMIGRHDHRYVAITFDDGYRDFYLHAFPVLAKHGFQATVFIVTGLTGDEPIRQNGREYLTWGEIREIFRSSASSVAAASAWFTWPKTHS